MPPDLAAELERINRGKDANEIPGNCLDCRKPDGEERRRKTAKDKHEERLRQINKRVNLANLPPGFAGGTELRKRFRAYFDCDKRFDRSGYQSVHNDRYTGLHTDK